MFDKENKKGFTLIELLVSVSIIGTIAGIFFANYRKTSGRADVRMMAQKLVSEIRMVQNYSLSLKMAPVSGVVPVGGWGVRLYKGDNKMLIYADDDMGGPNILKKYSPGNDELFRAIDFPNNITIYDNRINGIDNGNQDDYLYVAMLAPDPDTFICGSNNEGGAVLQISDADFVDIDLIYHDDVSTITTIRINKFGLVDVN